MQPKQNYNSPAVRHPASGTHRQAVRSGRRFCGSSVPVFSAGSWVAGADFRPAALTLFTCVLPSAGWAASEASLAPEMYSRVSGSWRGLGMSVVY